MKFRPTTGCYEKVKSRYYDALRKAKSTTGKQARAEAVAELKKSVIAELIPDPTAEADAVQQSALFHAWHALEEKVVRDLILAGTRADGRDAKTLRRSSCEIDVLPRVHGSAVFQRGETQALITVTLGTGRDEQRVDGLIDEYSKKFMLDYNFPSFSVGEVRPIRGPGRREIGHGALAERSVKPVLPDPEVFPYTIRVISDILESNGSSSMASVCGATLGLMAAGVPITNPVAGISVGLVKEDEKLDPAHRHHRRRGPLRRHGFQDRRHAERHHRHPARPEDQRHQRRDHQGHAGPKPRGPHRNPAQDADRDLAAQAGDLRLGAAPAADAHSAGQDRRADRPGRQDDPRHPGVDRRRDRSRGRRHGDDRQLRRSRVPRRPWPRSKP